MSGSSSPARTRRDPLFDSDDDSHQTQQTESPTALSSAMPGRSSGSTAATDRGEGETTGLDSASEQQTAPRSAAVPGTAHLRMTTAMFDDGLIRQQSGSLAGYTTQDTAQFNGSSKLLSVNGSGSYVDPWKTPAATNPLGRPEGMPALPNKLSEASFGQHGLFTSGSDLGTVARATASRRGPVQDMPEYLRDADHLTINLVPEKEGFLMFKHVNYTISSARRGTQVVRRYSDFVWLMESLLKRYPFRQIPLLPPKRLAVNGHYLSADNQFIERRRNGLARFCNSIVRHPKLRHDSMVDAFLSNPSDLSSWRKSASTDINEEFYINLDMETQTDINPEPDMSEVTETLRLVKASLPDAIDSYVLVIRMSARQKAIAIDAQQISEVLKSHAISPTSIPQLPLAPRQLEVALLCSSRYYDRHAALLMDEVQGWEDSELEDFKRERDTLVSARDMLDRWDRFGGNNNALLEKRIANSLAKIEKLRNSPTLKPEEAVRLEDRIEHDRQHIQINKRREIYYSKVLAEEFEYLFATKLLVPRLLWDHACERLKYAELISDNWRQWESTIRVD